MIGFEIAQLNLNDALHRLEELKEVAVLPVDEEGLVIEDDELAMDSAREIRLLLQRILDLDTAAFLAEMRTLFFHLFAADHEHFRDLLVQAARKEPTIVRQLVREFLTSEDVIFIDDQYTLHDLIDVLEEAGTETLTDLEQDEYRAILAEPFFRLPSIHARLLKLLGPTLDANDMPIVRRLFEMDWIPAKELTWEQLVPLLPADRIPAAMLTEPKPRLRAHEDQVLLSDFEDLHWMAGIEATPVALRFRMLGCMVAEGPGAGKLFIEISELQPETAFQVSNFETDGQRHYFLQALELFRQDVGRDAHRSAGWLTDLPAERTWPWAPDMAKDPWPRAVRELIMHWGEFANPTDSTDFAGEAAVEVKTLDAIVEKIVALLKKYPLPTADHLDEASALLIDFQTEWNRMLPKILSRMELLP